MGKFFAGALISTLAILGYQHFTSASDEAKTDSKDTITVQLSDQTIELPDTTKKDSVK